jgi:type IV secretory pathway VirB10-like protein
MSLLPGLPKTRAGFMVPALAIAGFAVTLGISLWQSRSEQPLSTAPPQVVETGATPQPMIRPEPVREAPATPPAEPPVTPPPVPQDPPPADPATPARRLQGESPDTPGYYLHSHRDM